MSRPKRMAPSLAANWTRIAARVRSSRSVALFLDFDGTMVNIAPRPGLVRVSPAIRRVLRRLARNPRVRVVVISGRRRAELLRHIAVPGIHYFGLYGSERDGRVRLPRAVHSALHRARKQFSVHLSSFPGVWVENKTFSLSVHFLGVSPAVQPKARRKVRSLLRPFRRTLRIMENIRDTEIVPRSIEGKGIAVKRFLANSARRKVLPFYFGDDISDEPAFAALRRGISVLVGAKRPTNARYSIPGPPELPAFLTRLETALI
jgi:trehalose 6-phosphate phosphatase